MARSLQRFRIAFWASAVFAISMAGLCPAQSNYSPLADTPSQRWLPPVSTYPDQPDQQAEMLSKLRGLMQKSNESKVANSPRLSDSEIQSLKNAMKQFNGNLPDGLSSESLDAIPSDLISKALTNPELMRQAKELAEQFSKGKQPNSNEGPGKAGGSSSNNNRSDSKQNDSPEENQQPDPNDSTKSRSKRPQPKEPTREPESPPQSSSEDFADLIEKLRSTQQQYEKNQIQPSDLSSSKEPSSNSGPSANSTDIPQTPRPRAAAPNAKDRSGPSAKSTSDGSSPSDSNRIAPATPRKNGTVIPPTSSAPEKSKKEPSGPTNPNPRSINRSNPPEGGNQDSQTLPGAGKTNGLNGTSESDKNPSMSMRQELEKRGFRSTLQKIVEDAQRASQAARVTTDRKPSAIESADKRAESKTAESKTALPQNAETKKPEEAAAKQTSQNLPRSAESPPRPPQPDTAFSKGMKQTSKALNDFWTQISKSDSNATTKNNVSKTSPPTSSAPPATFDPSSVTNPFSYGILQGLLVLGIAVAIGLFAFRYKVRTEQIRREIEEAKMAPKIDEIRTRDDVVRAFHAMTKQRFQSAQAWWTNRYVAEKFEHALPECATPIRTLSGIYEQARYFPRDHQLSADQIEDAKMALKQCRG